MEKGDIQASARVLGVAMLENPLHAAVFQGKGEKARMEIEKMFYRLLTDMPGIIFVAKERQHIIGVMRMKSCRGRKAEDVPTGAKDENDLDWRKSIWRNEWARHDPAALHWHLGPVGVLPAHQGSGVGTRLMQRFCMEADSRSARGYLETDLDRNVRFYEKFGFEVVSESLIFDVKNRYMLRPPADNGVRA